jgi:hypothetical protein
MGHVKCDYIKRLITLTSDNIKQLSLYQKNDIILRGPRDLPTTFSQESKLILIADTQLIRPLMSTFYQMTLVCVY